MLTTIRKCTVVIAMAAGIIANSKATEKPNYVFVVLNENQGQQQENWYTTDVPIIKTSKTCETFSDLTSAMNENQGQQQENYYPTDVPLIEDSETYKTFSDLISAMSAMIKLPDIPDESAKQTMQTIWQSILSYHNKVNAMVSMGKMLPDSQNKTLIDALTYVTVLPKELWEEVSKKDIKSKKDINFYTIDGKLFYHILSYIGPKIPDDTNIIDETQKFLGFIPEEYTAEYSKQASKKVLSLRQKMPSLAQPIRSQSPIIFQTENSSDKEAPKIRELEIGKTLAALYENIARQVNKLPTSEGSLYDFYRILTNGIQLGQIDMENLSKIQAQIDKEPNNANALNQFTKLHKLIASTSDLTEGIIDIFQQCCISNISTSLMYVLLQYRSAFNPSSKEVLEQISDFFGAMLLPSLMGIRFLLSEKYLEFLAMLETQ